MLGRTIAQEETKRQRHIAINNAYDIQIISTEGLKTKEEWREDCKTLALAAADKIPEGREKSIVLTKIEEALLWGQRAIDRSMPDTSQQQHPSAE